MLAKDLGERLARFRLSRNLRQVDLAEQSGISRGAVARIEAGEGGTIDSLLRIMQALGLADRTEMLLPDASLSPLDPRSEIGPRQRARLPSADERLEKPWSWGE
ncbi:helix-turn-helix transcriptional regulator [Salipiger pacificus]|uniref:Helix-turn-helix transcriptional regulator n=1 Tax=Salipiger mangrovisoli TaxID=2865933 RepID=A0ABR9XAN2_9RHOB|nr:helix-turn-helix transcriptional regulator [Salipiger mangrovisoli]